MANPYILLPHFEPSTALRFIAAIAKNKEHNHILSKVKVQIEAADIPIPGHMPAVSICLEDQRGQSKNRQWQNAYALVEEIYNKITNGTPSRTNKDDAYQPVADALPNLLIKSHVPDDPSRLRSARHNAKQKLLITPGISATKYVSLLRYATSFKVAAAKTDADAYTLYFLVDDVARFSAFQSAVNGGLFAEDLQLDCYISEQDGHERYLFLPGDIHPKQKALDHFCDILLTVPGLFGIQEGAEIGKVIAAVSLPPSDKPESKAQLFFTAHLSFSSEGLTTPSTTKIRSFDIVSLNNNPDALQQLQNEIRQLDPQIGYRLRLRKTRYRRPNENEHKRLTLAQIEINERIAELTSLGTPRPMLFRFSQDQLPVLADVLRSYPVQELARLRYAFQGTTDRFSEGVHYLIVNPDVVMVELDPLIYWDTYGVQLMRFWLDPHWARFYRRNENKAFVFVPHGMTLYPTMHSWGATTMDAYLRDILGDKYHGGSGVSTLSNAPLYLFDGDAKSDSELYLTILDRNQFAPLDSVRIGWLNDNLSLLDAVGVDSFIEQMADHTKQQRIAESVREATQGAETKFEKIATQINKTMVQITNDLTTCLTTELKRIVDETEDLTQKAQALQRRVEELESLHQEMTTLANKTNRKVAQVENKIPEVAQQTENLTSRVERVIDETERQRLHLQENTEQAVEVLKQTQFTLKAKLAELRMYM